MVFTYFKRARFHLNDFNELNFYLALFLASDVEDDVDDYKYEILPWALGSKWRMLLKEFYRKKDELLRRIGYRAIVSRRCCEEVMSFMPDHEVWKRVRAEDHGGATRAYMIRRSRRLLLNRCTNDEDEINFPTGPDQSPSPCPLCLIGHTLRLSSQPVLINSTIRQGYLADFNNNINGSLSVNRLISINYVQEKSSRYVKNTGKKSRSEDNEKVNANANSIYLISKSSLNDKSELIDNSLSICEPFNNRREAVLCTRNSTNIRSNSSSSSVKNEGKFEEVNKLNAE
jgi:speedy